MCLQVFLVSDRSLSVPLDSADYPDLLLREVFDEGESERLFKIRRVTRGRFAYSLSPAGYCGCYFGYQSEENFNAYLAERRANPSNQYAGSIEEAEQMWRGLTNAVKSLGKFLRDHSETHFSVYAVWEHDEGLREPVRVQVSPSYFDGPEFLSLPQDVVLTIGPEPTADVPLPWNREAVRDHLWMGMGDCALGNEESR